MAKATRLRLTWSVAALIAVAAALLVAIGLKLFLQPKSHEPPEQYGVAPKAESQHGPSEVHPDTRQATPRQEARFASLRATMVQQQLAARDIRDSRVLEAMGKVPRHEFVPNSLQEQAYSDIPLPIGSGQTISQPYIVAFMTEAVAPQPHHRVLEIGTGSGYQAAVLAELVSKVFTIEIIPELAEQARARLQRLGYRNVHVRTGDGYLGWPEAAPFDAIVVTCGADHVPPALLEQLKPGGRLIIPVGDTEGLQWLRVLQKDAAGQIHSRDVLPVRFVPLRRTP